ncbi:MAG: glycosyltransferase [Lachnospiraceae bacterium]|nr:glycosyltransferase [Lachnospiraceae bacterium]
MKVDVIIPVYKPDASFLDLIDRLQKQTYEIHQIILMNTEEKYFEKLVYGTSFVDNHRNVKVFHLSKREFDHGKTRHIGMEKSKADICLLMTQDAIPADDRLVEKLVKALEQQDVISAYARQLPNEKCNPIEKYLRSFNYPERSRVKTLEDLPVLGIKTFFCSNVCCAYKREKYMELGGFVRHTIFNEDMIFASKVIRSGYAIAYEADAKVIHSHNYTCAAQLHRNFDLGVSQAQHPEVFADVPSEGEGIRSVKTAAAHLWNEKLWTWIPYLIAQSGFKYMGYLLGKKYKKLPLWMVKKLSMNKEYWN